MDTRHISRILMIALPVGFLTWWLSSYYIGENDHLPSFITREGRYGYDFPIILVVMVIVIVFIVYSTIIGHDDSKNSGRRNS